MIPVDRKKAESKTSKTNPNGWGMPEKNLLARLLEKTSGRIVLADEGDDTDLKARCSDTNFLKAVEFHGSFVRNPAESTKADPVAAELTIEG